MQVWPRKRAKRSIAKVRYWHDNNTNKLLAFIGYKAGMTHSIIRDHSPHTQYKNEDVSIPITIIECPPLRPLSLRFYQNSYYGLKCIAEVYSKAIPKDLKKYINAQKKEVKEPESFDEVRLIVSTQPHLAGFGQKRPSLIEVAASGKNKEEKIAYLKSLLDKDIRIQDIFKEQKFLDVHGVTKGKGYQGTVKRFGVTIRQHKAEKTKRGIGTLGSWHPSKVQFTVPQAGRMGYHQRTEYNKENLLIDADPKKINPKGGFLHYGMVKNDYIILKGSIVGPAKRAVILTPNMRKKSSHNYEIKHISLESKQ